LDPTLQQTLKVLWNVEVLSQMIMADPLVHLNPVVDELVCPWMKEFSNNIHIIKEQVPKHIVPRMISRRTGINSVDRHWGQGYLDFGGNMLSTLQALRHFAQHLPSRNVLFTFEM
jgi:hypothetical protein